MVSTLLFRHCHGPKSKHNSRESQRRSKLKISLPDQTNPGLDFYDHITCWVHLGTMVDAAIYFIRHDEAQLHSTKGALGQTRLKRRGRKSVLCIIWVGRDPRV
jgi:hypothetical protein